MRERIRDKGRLEHILESIDDVVEFINGVDFEEFMKNKILRFAIIRGLAIIGEASYKLTKEFREGHKEIEWKSIISMRHILVHGYYDTDEIIVWDTANSLSELKEKIQILYNNEP